MIKFFSSKPYQPAPAMRAFAMAELFAPRGPWTILAVSGPRHVAQTFTSPGEAVAFIEKHARAGLIMRLLLANTVSMSKRSATDADLLSSRYVSIFVPQARRVALEAIPHQPTAIIDVEGGFVAVWRFAAPVPIAVARRVAGVLCKFFGGRDFNFVAPLPVITQGVKLVSFEAARFCLPTDFNEAPAPKRQRKAPGGLAVMLGEDEDGGQVHWAPFEEETKLLNFGVLVTGDPGSGKTQTLNVLIDGVARMGLPVCIFDFKNDYAAPDFVKANRLKVHDVRRNGIPFNPLMPSANEDGQAQPIEHIFTIAGVLKRVFGLGDRQAAVLRDAMKDAFERRGIDPQKWAKVDHLKPPAFADVVAILEEQKEAKNAQAVSILDRIAPLYELGLFPAGNDQAATFETMLDDRIVLSLFALPNDEIKAALAELIIIRLHGVLLRRSQPRKLTRLLVLDEAWRVAHSTHLENLAREGRAFGAGIAIGTQYPGDLPADLSGALDTKIYLKNQQPDHKAAIVRALCGSNSGPEASSLHGVLEQLKQFEGFIQNQHYLPYARFKLVPYFQRGKANRG